MERLFVLKMLSRTQQATKFCGDSPETTAFKSYAANQYSDLPAVSFLSAKRQRVPKDFQQYSTKQYAVCAEGFALHSFFYVHLN